MGRPPLALRSAGKVTVKPILDKTTGKVAFYEARCRVRDIDGVTRQVLRRGPSKSKAEARVREELQDRLAPTSGPLSVSSTFGELADVWLEHIKATRDSDTHRVYDSTLRTVRPHLEALRLREITGAQVAHALTQLRPGRSANGLRMCRKVISGPLKLAVSWQLLERNPAQGLAPIEGKGKQPRALTVSEDALLMSFVDTDRQAKRSDIADIIRFMAGTGVRIGEALAVRWRDVDLARGHVEITGTVKRVKGTGLVRQPAPKTEAGERTLHLPGALVLTLRMRFDGRDMRPDHPVFWSAAGSWRDPSNVQRELRRVRDAVGMEWVSSHVFRKTAATALDEAGFTARQVADQLGHAKPSMTQDVYMGRSRGNTQSMAEVLDGRFSSPARR